MERGQLEVVVEREVQFVVERPDAVAGRDGLGDVCESATRRRRDSNRSASSVRQLVARRRRPRRDREPGTSRPAENARSTSS